MSAAVADARLQRGDYERRIEAALGCLARASALDPAQVIHGFHAVQRLLSRGAKSAQVSLLGAVLAALDHTKPTTYELIARLGETRGLAYLTYGPPLSTLRAVVENLLRAAFDAYLDAGGDSARAEVLAHCFRAAFPDLRLLEQFNRDAGAFCVGFVPQSKGLGLKSYFNTRLLADGQHRQRVRGIVNHAGCLDVDFDRIFDILYDRERGARFEGVGVDIGQRARVKLYVRVALPEALELARRVATVLDLDRESLAGLDINFNHGILARSLELGVGLSDDGRRSLKVTYLFPREGNEPATLAAAHELLRVSGHATDILDELAAILRTSAHNTLHGIGVEYPQESPPKVNLYFLP